MDHLGRGKSNEPFLNVGDCKDHDPTFVGFSRDDSCMHARDSLPETGQSLPTASARGQPGGR